MVTEVIPYSSVDDPRIGGRSGLGFSDEIHSFPAVPWSFPRLMWELLCTIWLDAPASVADPSYATGITYNGIDAANDIAFRSVDDVKVKAEA